jgi:hypothetical protein
VSGNANIRYILRQVTFVEEVAVIRIITLLLTLVAIGLPTSTHAGLPVTLNERLIGIPGGVSPQRFQRALERMAIKGVRVVPPTEPANLPGTTFANIERRSRTWGLIVPIRDGKAVVWIAVTPGPGGVNARATAVYADHWTSIVAASHRFMDPMLPTGLKSPEARATLVVRRLKDLLTVGRTDETVTRLR